MAAITWRATRDGIHVGSALEETAAITWGMRPIPPGQPLLVMLMPLRNVSDEALTIRQISPLNDATPAAVRLVRIELAPRGAGDSVAQGTYVTYPPGEMDERGICETQEMQRAQGFFLEPSTHPADRAIVAIVFRAMAPGETAFRMGRVIYEQAGEVFRQDFDLTVQFEVKRDARPRRPDRDERRCLRERRVRRLRGLPRSVQEHAGDREM